MCVGQIWVQAELGWAIAPTGTRKGQDRVLAMQGWDRVQHSPLREETGGGQRLEQSTCWHTQDLGLGMGLVRELGGLLCLVVAPTGEHERWNWGKTRLGRVAAPISMCMSWI